jgi:hypothetical protein
MQESAASAFEWLPITVTVTDREDGGLRVRSPDVPGLILSGSVEDRQRIWDMVGPAVKRLLQVNRGLQVLDVYYRDTSPAPGEGGEVDVSIRHLVVQVVPKALHPA